MHSKALYSLIISLFLAGCGGTTVTRAPVEDSSLTAAPSDRGAPPPAPHRAPETDQRAAPEQSEMLFQVLSAIGVDYKYGGNSPATGYDCSGLVAHVFRAGYGISLPRNTYGQSRVGTPVSESELQPGDLVFYNTQNRPYSHVGIYLGDGRFVHAPRTGAEVRIEKLDNRYWSQRWSGARRVAHRM